MESNKKKDMYKLRSIFHFD